MTTITEPVQMPRPLLCGPADETWKQRLQESGAWWYVDSPQASNPKEQEAMNEALILRDRLLGFGGDLACMALYDPDYQAIMERGQFWYGDHTRFRRGRPSQCHSNSALLWDTNSERFRIATGYALSDDGCWRSHSWVVEPLKTKYRIWETTEPRIAYFGFVMTPEECETFYDQNA